MSIFFVIFFWLVAVTTWPVTIMKFVYDVFKLDEPFWSAFVSDGGGGLIVFILAVVCLITTVRLTSD